MVRVLIVEDQDMARLALSVALGQNSNIEISDMASDGLEGVEKALALKPDLVIMDIGLPTIDGIDATRKIKEHNPNIKVLMYTSREDENDIFDSFQAGADGYITKGATREQTIAAVLAGLIRLLQKLFYQTSGEVAALKKVNAVKSITN